MFADSVPRTGRYLAGSMPRVVCTLPLPWCVESLSKCVQIWLAILAAQSDGQHHDSQTPNLALASRSSLIGPDAQTSSSRRWQGQAESVERAWRARNPTWRDQDIVVHETRGYADSAVVGIQWYIPSWELCNVT
jgi:hypothetical protein